MKGIGVFPGIGIGKVLFKEEKQIIIEEKDITNYEEKINEY